MVRRYCFWISGYPPKKSMTVCEEGSKKRPLIVKSLLRTSSSGDPQTLSRVINSSLSVSPALKVETSNIFFPNRMWARRNLLPIRMLFLKISLISSGRAEVEMSKSLGFFLRRRSRTLPPTRYAVWPERASFSMMYRACSSISRMSSPCSSRG